MVLDQATKKINRIKEGLFTCNVDNIAYFLNISEITIDKFYDQKGLNVVEDLVFQNDNRKFFLLAFYSEIDGNKNFFDFINLKDEQTLNSNEPFFYIDENGNSFCPHLSYGEYTIEYQKINYFFWKRAN